MIEENEKLVRAFCNATVPGHRETPRGICPRECAIRPYLDGPKPVPSTSAGFHGHGLTLPYIIGYWRERDRTEEHES